MLLSDFFTIIDSDLLTIYPTSNYFENNELSNPILLVSHEFTLTGAPIALLNMVKALCSSDYTVFVLCNTDGDLRTVFNEYGANVIIYPNYNSDQVWINELAAYFPHVIINTLSLLNTVINFHNVFKNTFWWLHESEYMFKCVDDQVKQQLGISLLTLSKNNFSNVIMGAVSPQVIHHAKEYLGFQAKLVPFCIPDDPAPSSLSDNNHSISFLQIGSINANKRPDLLVEVALKLPEHIFSKCNFTFVGNKNNADSLILNTISEFAESFFNVRFLSTMPHADIYSIYDETDIVVITSLQETVSSIAVEACMKQKLCICPNTAGITDFMKTGDEMLIFPAGDVDALYETVLYATDNHYNLDHMRKNGRNMYETYFSEHSLKSTLNEIFLIH